MIAPFRAALGALAGAAIAWACAGTATSDDLFGKVPLAKCDTECEGDLECIDGICTTSCEEDSDCSSISATATCAGSGSSQACDVGCESDADCQELGGDYECSGGNCRAVTSGSGSTDGGAAGGGSAGSGSGGTAGGTAAPMCELPMEVGPCEAAFERFWFNAKTGACEPFTYGGCQGNDNNFESLGACNAACGGGEECGCCDCRPMCAGSQGGACENVRCKPCAPPPECSCDAMCAGRKLPDGCAIDCLCPNPVDCPPLEGFCDRACSEPFPDVPAGCPVPKCACVDPGCPSPDAYCKAACNGEPLPKTPDGCPIPSCACPPIDYCARGFVADPGAPCPVMVKELCFKSTDDACRCAGCEPDACAILESAPAQVACGM